MKKGLSGAQVVALILVSAVVFYLINRAVESGRVAFETGAAINDVLPALPAAIAADPFRISTNTIDLIAGLAVVAIIWLAVIYKVAARKNTRPGEEQGSAAWANARDIKPFRDKDPRRELQFTQTEALSVDSFKTKRNTNVLVLGASGTGKTRSYILPNLRKLNASTATTDPKGEIIRATKGELERQGIQVRTLNLVDLRASGQFNPVRYFNPDEPETGIAQLAECIIANTAGKDSKGDAFWDRAERALLTALIAYVWATTPETDGQEANLPLVLELHKGMDGSEEDKDARDSETDLKFEAARAIVAEYNANPYTDDDPAVMKVLDFACRMYRVYEQGPVETRKSVVISLGVRLAPLDMHDVRHMLSTDTLALDRIGYEPTAMFLQIPDTHATFKFIAAMFWQSLFEQTIYQADHEADGRLPRMLHAFLDEFANIGMIPGFERLMATIRSRNISASLVFQNFSQGKALFRDDWDGIVGNCDTKLFLGGDDMTTSKWLSERLGNETVISSNQSRSHGASGSWSESDQIVKRALLDPDEVSQLDNEMAIVMIRGLKPFLSKKLAA